MGLDTLVPVREILNASSVCVIGSNGDAVGTGLASLELEGVDSGFSEKVRDASDVFELITHCLLPLYSPTQSSNFYTF
jgi:hypothetical protein